MTEAIPSYWVSIDDSAKFSDIQTSLRDFIAQKAAEWIAGQSDIDKEWDSYLEQLNTLGLQEYITIREKALQTTEEAVTETAQ